VASERGLLLEDEHRGRRASVEDRAGCGQADDPTTDHHDIHGRRAQRHELDLGTARQVSSIVEKMSRSA
jgi:hypothetical protein